MSSSTLGVAKPGGEIANLSTKADDGYRPPIHAPQKIGAARKFVLRFQRLVRGIIAFFVYPALSDSGRHPKQWIFGYQDDGFAGNSKFLYLWLNIHRPDIKAVWITGSKRTYALLKEAKLPVRKRWTFSGIGAAVKASAFFFDHSPTDVNVILSRGAKLVNLWHGVGIKPIQFNDPRCVVNTHFKHRKRAITRAIFIDYVLDPDYVIATSPFMRTHFANQFRLPEQRCPELGYPRLDCSFDPKLKVLALSLSPSWAARLGWHEFKRHYVYLPTFRDTGRPFLDEALPDLGALNSILIELDAVLYIKLHPKSFDQLSDDWSNIKIWEAGIDYYPMLSDFDLCISDYSSVIYDYVAVREQGAVTYTFDYEQYTKGDRNLLYDFDDCVPGPWLHTFSELCDYIRSQPCRSDKNQKHESVRDLFWGGSSEPASQAVTSFVEKALV